MLEKGEMSFIFLWILTPVMILGFQNCSMVPLETHAENSQVAENRMPACHAPQAGNCFLAQ